MAAPIVIVGAGQAAASLAGKLRTLGHNGDVVIIGREKVPPYQRPPLSKKYLSGEVDLERLLVKSASWYQENKVDLRLGVEATALDRGAKRLTLSNGESLSYSKLALTTGATPRRLPAEKGGALQNVFTLRDLDDADRLAPHMKAGKRLIVVGGGYIGLEAAAVARSKGLEVTVIEVAPRILQRVAAAETSDYYRQLHQGRGVQILEATGLDCLEGEAGVFAGAKLADGRKIPADLAIVGIGVLANDGLARGAGLKAENGIWVNETCQSDDPDIFAAGDCAIFPFRGQPTRLESVQNAVDQAEHVASVMLGATTPYLPKPWFWSDQYDVKLQIAGLNRGYDATVLRAGKRPGSQSVWYFAGDQLLAVDAMNDALSYAMAKKIVDAGKTLPKSVAGDPASDLKAWAS